MSSGNRSEGIIPTPSLKEAREFPLDLKFRRIELETHVVVDWLAKGGLWLVRDEAGVGKTTSVSEGLLERGERVFFACERHEKADEFPDPYFHVKGRKQPGMCPVFELSGNNPTRKEFERFDNILSHKEAHRRVDGVDDDCPYLENRKERENHDLVVGVHHQLTDFTDRLAVIDETPTVDLFKEKWPTADLERISNTLRKIPGARWLADWVDSLRRDITNTDGVDLTIEPPGRSVTAEELAELKIAYNDWVIYGPSNTPPGFDAILGALVAVDFEPEACRAAIDGPTTLEYCPRCHAPTNLKSCPNCFWERDRFDLLDYRRESYSRVTAYADGDKLVFTKIPAVDDLPDDVMILDATGRPAIVARLFGVPEDEIRTNDGPDFEADMHLTEISNGQYHGTTIDESKSLQKWIQRTIDYVNRNHEHVFYVAKRSVMDNFDFPQEGNVIRYYGALRGMDIHKEWVNNDDVAVCMIGAPHPNVRKLRHVVAALDGSGADAPEEYEVRTVRVYGEPIEVGTKAYDGLLGEFFRSAREDELVQAAHRVRPILADDTVHVYKLTNVPTRLPVDDRLTWREFLNEGLTEGAVSELVNPLCEAYGEGAIETSKSEIYDIVGVESRDSGGKRVTRWLDTLEDSGVVEIDGFASDSSHRVVLDMGRLRKIA